MKTIVHLLILSMSLGMLFAFSPLCAGAQSKPFEDGDRVLIIGDSITHYGVYHMLLNEFYQTRYPGSNIKFFSGGRSGDTAAGALVRLPEEIEKVKPTKATVMLGMNDVGRTSYSAAIPSETQLKSRMDMIDTYEKNVEKIVDLLQEKKIEVTLITPTPYDDTLQAAAVNNVGYGGALREATLRMKAIGQKKGVAVIDVNTPMNAINFAIQKDNPAATIIGADRIHPGVDGHNVMAQLILQQQGALGDVASVHIDGSGAKLITAKDAKVTAITKMGGGLQFTYQPQRLPAFADSNYMIADSYVNFTKDINRETITITNLTPAVYQLKIDGKEAGEYTHIGFSYGVNIATLAANAQRDTLAKIRSVSTARYNTQIKLRDKAFTLWMMKSQGYSDMKKYYDDKYTNMDAFNRTRLDNALYAMDHEADIDKQVEAYEQEMESLIKPAACKMEIIKTDKVLPVETPTPTPSPTPTPTPTPTPVPTPKMEIEGIKEHWGEMYIERLGGEGLLKGMYSGGDFAPDKPVTRAEFAALAARAGKFLAKSNTNPFSDVDKLAWHYEDLIASYENGLIKGTGDGLFSPDLTISRQDMAVMLQRGFAYPTAPPSDFVDRAEIADYAKQAVDSCVKKGIITGNPGKVFEPEGLVTRAQMAAVLCRVMVSR